MSVPTIRDLPPWRQDEIARRRRERKADVIFYGIIVTLLGITAGLFWLVWP